MDKDAGTACSTSTLGAAAPAEPMATIQDSGSAGPKPTAAAGPIKRILCIKLDVQDDLQRGRQRLRIVGRHDDAAVVGERCWEAVDVGPDHGHAVREMREQPPFEGATSPSVHADPASAPRDATAAPGADARDATGPPGAEVRAGDTVVRGRRGAAAARG